jgi:hypothetical protein
VSHGVLDVDYGVRHERYDALHGEQHVVEHDVIHGVDLDVRDVDL